MNNYLKKLRECSKRKIERLLDDNTIVFKNNIFSYKKSGEPVENIQFKKNYREDEDIDDIDDEDELNFDDDSASFNN